MRNFLASPILIPGLQGTFEREEQVEGLDYLKSQAEWRIDPQRVAVHGWSYGGYLSLQALCQRPDVFRVSGGGGLPLQ